MNKKKNEIKKKSELTVFRVNRIQSQTKSRVNNIQSKSYS